MYEQQQHYLQQQQGWQPQYDEYGEGPADAYDPAGAQEGHYV